MAGLHNLRPEPVTLNAGHRVGTIEAAEVVGPMETVAKGTSTPLGEFILRHLSLVQQRQLTQLLEQYRNIFSRDDEDIGHTPVLEHTFETQRPPVRLPYSRQNPAVWRGGSRAGTADVGEQHYSPLQQSLGVPHSHGAEERWQAALLSRFLTLEASTVKDAHSLPCIVICWMPFTVLVGSPHSI